MMGYEPRQRGMRASPSSRGSAGGRSSRQAADGSASKACSPYEAESTAKLVKYSCSVNVDVIKERIEEFLLSLPLGTDPDAAVTEQRVAAKLFETECSKAEMEVKLEQWADVAAELHIMVDSQQKQLYQLAAELSVHKEHSSSARHDQQMLPAVAASAAALTASMLGAGNTTPASATSKPAAELAKVSAVKQALQRMLSASSTPFAPDGLAVPTSKVADLPSMGGDGVVFIQRANTHVAASIEESSSPQRNLGPHLAAAARASGQHMFLDASTPYKQLLEENMSLKQQLEASSVRLAHQDRALQVSVGAQVMEREHQVEALQEQLAEVQKLLSDREMIAMRATEEQGRLRKALLDAEIDMQKMSVSMEDQRKRLKQAEEELLSVRAEISTVQSELAAERTSARAELSAAQSSLAGAREQAAADASLLASQLSIAQEQLKDAHAKLVAATSHLQEAKQDAACSQEETARAVAAAAVEANQLREQAAAVHAQLQLRHEELAQADLVAHKLEAQAAELKHSHAVELGHMQAALAAATASNEHLRLQLQVTSDHSHKVSKEAVAAREELAVMHSELSRLQGALVQASAAAEQSTAHLQAQKEAKEQHVHDLNAQLQARDVQARDLRAQLDQARNDGATLNARVLQLEAEMAQLSQKEADACACAAKHAANLAALALERQAADMAQQEGALMERVHTAELDAAALRAELEQAVGLRMSLAAQVGELQQELAAAQGYSVKLRAQVEDLQADVDALKQQAQAAAQALDNEHTAVESAMSEQELQMAGMEEQLRAMLSARHEDEAKVSTLVKEVAMMQDKWSTQELVHAAAAAAAGERIQDLEEQVAAMEQAQKQVELEQGQSMKQLEQEKGQLARELDAAKEELTAASEQWSTAAAAAEAALSKAQGEAAQAAKRVQELEADVGELQEALGEEHDERVEMEEVVERLEQELVVQRSMVARLTAQLGSQDADLKKQLDACQAELAATEARAAEELDTVEAGAAERLTAVLEQLAATEARASEQLTAVTALSAQVDKLEQQTDHLREQLAASDAAANARLTEKEVSVAAQLSEKDKQIELLQEQVSEAKGQTLQALQAIQDQLQTQVQKAQDKVVQLEASLEQQARVHADELEAAALQYRAVQEEVVQVHTQLDEAERKAAAAQQEASDVRKHLIAAEEAAQRIEQQLEQAQAASTAQLQQRIEELEVVITAYKQQVAAAVQEAADAYEEAQATRTQLVAAEQNVVAAQQQLADAHAATTTQLAQSEAKLRDAQEQLALADIKLQAAGTDLAAAHTRVADLEQQVVNVVAEKEGLQAQVIELQQGAEASAEQVTHASETAAAAQAHAEGVQHKQEGLRQALALSAVTAEELRAQLEDAQGQLRWRTERVALLEAEVDELSQRLIMVHHAGGNDPLAQYTSTPGAGGSSAREAALSEEVRDLRAQLESLMSQLQVQHVRMESAQAAADLAVEQLAVMRRNSLPSQPSADLQHHVGSTTPFSSVAAQPTVSSAQSAVHSVSAGPRTSTMPGQYVSQQPFASAQSHHASHMSSPASVSQPIYNSSAAMYPPSPSSISTWMGPEAASPRSSVHGTPTRSQPASRSPGPAASGHTVSHSHHTSPVLPDGSGEMRSSLPGSPAAAQHSPQYSPNASPLPAALPAMAARTHGHASQLAQPSPPRPAADDFGFYPASQSAVHSAAPSGVPLSQLPSPARAMPPPPPPGAQPQSNHCASPVPSSSLLSTPGSAASKRIHGMLSQRERELRRAQARMQDLKAHLDHLAATSGVPPVAPAAAARSRVGTSAGRASSGAGAQGMQGPSPAAAAEPPISHAHSYAVGGAHLASVAAARAAQRRVSGGSSTGGSSRGAGISAAPAAAVPAAASGGARGYSAGASRRTSGSAAWSLRSGRTPQTAAPAIGATAAAGAAQQLQPAVRGVPAHVARQYLRGAFDTDSDY